MKKVTDEEFAQIESLKERFADLVVRMGSLKLEECVLRQELRKITSSSEECEQVLIQLKEEEKTLFSALEEKYGTGINIETGEIT